MSKWHKGFTLLELLIVIGILAVLATMTVLVINPAEYLKQSHDVKRIADIDALDKALALAEFSEVSMGGASTTVFVSLVHTAADCAGLGLPTLPAGFSYHCVINADDLRKTDGTGWIPVNLASMPTGAPLSALPVDPKNDTTYFYVYIPGGSFALSALLESEKYMQQEGRTDSGPNPAKIEAGSDLKLLANAEGLIAHWSFDEGSGTVAGDVSGNGNSGALENGAAWGEGKLGTAIAFDGVDDQIVRTDGGAEDPLRLNGLSAVTFVAWVKSSNTTGEQKIIDKRSAWNGLQGYSWYMSGQNMVIEYGNGATSFQLSRGIGGYAAGQWYHLAITRIGTRWYYFKNGVSANSVVEGSNIAEDAVANFSLGRSVTRALAPYNGVIDDVRIYKRALGSTQIKALYDATK